MSKLRPKDSQVTRFFAAVGSLPEWDDHSLQFYVDVQKFLRPLSNRKFIRKTFRHHHPDVIFHRRRMYIGRWQWRTWSRLKVLHALTHFLVDTNTQPAHGPVFCRAFLTITRNVLGKDMADRLREAYRKNKVKYRKPRTDVTNPKGNPAALGAYRLQKHIEAMETPLWELLGSS